MFGRSRETDKEVLMSKAAQELYDRGQVSDNNIRRAASYLGLDEGELRRRLQQIQSGSQETMTEAPSVAQRLKNWIVGSGSTTNIETTQTTSHGEFETEGAMRRRLRQEKQTRDAAAYALAQARHKAQQGYTGGTHPGVVPPQDTRRVFPDEPEQTSYQTRRASYFGFEESDVDQISFGFKKPKGGGVSGGDSLFERKKTTGGKSLFPD